jgi:hypothetical protein
LWLCSNVLGAGPIIPCLQQEQVSHVCTWWWWGGLPPSNYSQRWHQT